MTYLPRFQKARSPLTLPMQIEHGLSNFYISSLCPQPLAAMAAVGRPQEQAADVASRPGHLVWISLCRFYLSLLPLLFPAWCLLFPPVLQDWHPGTHDTQVGDPRGKPSLAGDTGDLDVTQKD